LRPDPADRRRRWRCRRRRNVECWTAPDEFDGAPGSKEDFVQNVGDRVFFAFNESNISPEARRHPRKAGPIG